MEKDDILKVIPASPTKSFFVDMLTRDITLEDAILDLLDNCIDGALRVLSRKKRPHKNIYSGFYAEISFNKDYFEIRDNCGGISRNERDSAFKMGRVKSADDGLQTIGAFGIGMKRALFKMGRDCLVCTRSKSEGFQVSFDQKWFADDEEWNLQPKRNDQDLDHDGTHILVGELCSSTVKAFKEDSFRTKLIKLIESHFSVFISLGFKVSVNEKNVDPNPIKFRLQVPQSKKSGISPYIFRGEFEGVSVFITVGLRHEIPGIEESIDEQQATRYSSEYAGWTVICNDRIVLYCDKTILTGWGDAGVPAYHSQFRAISGVVEMRSTDGSKLPVTTTKRGIEADSALYGLVKNRMREGMKMFTSYTNQWKTKEGEAREHVRNLPSATVSEVREKMSDVKMSKTRGSGLIGEVYKPKLPLPKRNERLARITFYRDWKKVSLIAESIYADGDFEETREVAQEVGAHCFDAQYERAKIAR